MRNKWPQLPRAKHFMMDKLKRLGREWIWGYDVSVEVRRLTTTTIIIIILRVRTSTLTNFILNDELMLTGA